MEPYIDGLDQDAIVKDIVTTERGQETFKVNIDNRNNVMKEAPPGPLESESK